MKGLRFFWGHKIFRLFVSLVLYFLFYLSNLNSSIFFRFRDKSRKKPILKIFCSGGGIGDDIISLRYALEHTTRSERAIFICNKKSADCIRAVLKFYRIENISILPLDTEKYTHSIYNSMSRLKRIIRDFEKHKILVFRMSPVIEWNIFIIPLLFNRRVKVGGYLFGWKVFYEQGVDFSKNPVSLKTESSLYFYTLDHYCGRPQRSRSVSEMDVNQKTPSIKSQLTVCPVKTNLWPAGRWNPVAISRRICDICQSQRISNITLIGGPTDQVELERMKVYIKSINNSLEICVMSGSGWSDVIRTINESSYFFGVDNGLSHLAALLRVSTIDVVYTFSDPHVFAASNMSAYVSTPFIKLPCQPCVGRRWSPSDNSIVNCKFSGYCDKGFKLKEMGGRNGKI